ncbi:putative pyridoxamine phosphate oxidase [Phaeomoniella chlamydospora]|uniref:Putative pyridoxamine phosphate oxidase n=1 Tax=Phaeomoniella chlamydospora TaxID=158046 RepID=A0A0G2GMZ8_PHACM|nr:putative pyridoxamine phosphate oxidase [Phaeomoniella chlamydospora]
MITQVMVDTQPPLNYEASSTATHPQVSNSLPSEVVTCLNNARFLHLATCAPSPSNSLPIPHVSLMNYTFLPSTPFHTYPVIIMTTNPQSLKTRNLLSNPNVSLCVHDWVSHRPPTRADATSNTRTRSGSPPPAAARSSLASLLLNLNTSALSSISTTITGQAVFLDPGSEQEKWCKEAHLANNTFGDQAAEEARLFGGQVPYGPPDDANLEAGTCFIEGEDVKVVVVRVKEGRIADWKGGVKDWAVVGEEEGGTNPTENTGQGGLVNGIINE